jgi:hypothetical protein
MGLLIHSPPYLLTVPLLPSCTPQNNVERRQRRDHRAEAGDTAAGRGGEGDGEEELRNKLRAEA